MNWIDVVIVLIIVLSLWTGWKKGFILGTLDLSTWIGSVLAGFYFYRDLASLFEKYISSLGVWTFPLAFIVVILFARMIFSFIAGGLLSATPGEAHRHTTNQFLGIIPGGVHGIINATILAALLLALPISDGVSESTRNSKIANKLAYQVDWLDSRLSPIFDKAVQRSLSKLTVKPESNEKVELRYSVKNPKRRTDLEAEMLDMVNQERVKAGLSPLKPDPELAAVATEHSCDMFARDYFSHVTPDGRTLADRVRSAGVSFYVAGENLALGPTLEICHEGLMNSPGHRANILQKSFGRLGIGVLDGGRYGLMITQNFRN